MDKSKAQMKDALWAAFCRNYMEEKALEISTTEALEPCEALIKGVMKLKTTAIERMDMLHVLFWQFAAASAPGRTEYPVRSISEGMRLNQGVLQPCRERETLRAAWVNRW
jgi:hypothetical protein